MVNYFKKKNLLFLVVLAVGLILSGCGSNSNGVIRNDIVYEYAGSIGVGDFIDVEINKTDKTYQYTNLITDESGSGTFTSINDNFYEMDNGNRFAMIDDQMLLVSVDEEAPGQRLIAALKKANHAYGSEIAGTYNVATSLEGWVGEVTITPDGTDPSTGTVDVKLDINSDGDYVDTVDGDPEDMPGLSYSFDENYHAIKIIESNEFRHFGVFLNNQVGIFDSYMWDGTDWTGDGMFILVKQDTALNLSDYVGEYTYIDVDADYGVFELVVDGTDLRLWVDGEDTGITFSSTDLNDGNGVVGFDADFVEPEGTTEYWNFVFLPGQVIIAASSDDVTFEDNDGGFAVGVKTD